MTVQRAPGRHRARAKSTRRVHVRITWTSRGGHAASDHPPELCSVARLCGELRLSGQQFTYTQRKEPPCIQSLGEPPVGRSHSRLPSSVPVRTNRPRRRSRCRSDPTPPRGTSSSSPTPTTRGWDRCAGRSASPPGVRSSASTRPSPDGPLPWTRPSTSTSRSRSRGPPVRALPSMADARVASSWPGSSTGSRSGICRSPVVTRLPAAASSCTAREMSPSRTPFSTTTTGTPG
jgi:hypothetical protein